VKKVGDRKGLNVEIKHIKNPRMEAENTTTNQTTKNSGNLDLNPPTPWRKN
jgi:hypothetical protein